MPCAILEQYCHKCRDCKDYEYKRHMSQFRCSLDHSTECHELDKSFIVCQNKNDAEHLSLMELFTV